MGGFTRSMPSGGRTKRSQLKVASNRAANRCVIVVLAYSMIGKNGVGKTGSENISRTI